MLGSLQGEGVQALAGSHDRRKVLRVTAVPEDFLGANNTEAGQFVRNPGKGKPLVTRIAQRLMRTRRPAGITRRVTCLEGSRRSLRLPR
jgi:hypothetical protein